MKRLLVALALAAVVILLAVCGSSESEHSSSGASTAGTFSVEIEKIPLQDGGFAEAEHGVLHVPVRRDVPGSGTVALEVYRFPAADGVPQSRPPIFNLNGGPGYPGLGGALQRKGFYESQIAPFTEVADLVVVGQRGIGSSSPDTVCEGPGDLPFDREPTDEEFRQLVEETSTRCRKRWEAEGLDLKGFTVLEAAADLEDVRKALGYDKVTIIGGSFGSHWGMAFMRFYPDSVERVILHGTEGPDHTYDSPTGVLNALTRIAEAAEQDPDLAAKIPAGGLIKAFEAVIARLERKPIQVSAADSDGNSHEVWIGPDDVRDVALGLGTRVSSRRGMPSWPAGILRMYEGDYSRLARAVLESREGGGQFPTASFFMLDCGSGISRARLAQLQSDPAIAVVGDLSRFYETACPAWDSDLGEGFRENFESKIPTVIVQGNWDTSTPYENSRELEPFFKNRRYVLVRGGSHGALGEAVRGNPDFRAALYKFLATGDWADLPEDVVLPPIEWESP